MINLKIKPIQRKKQSMFSNGILFVALLFSPYLATAAVTLLAMRAATWRDANTVVIANSYASNGSVRALIGPSADALMLKKIASDKIDLQQDANDLTIARIFSDFGDADCPAGTAVRLIWFSGHADTGNQDYALIADGLGETGRPLASLLALLAQSNCQFVVGFDATPPLMLQVLPRNVTAIWANRLGGDATDHKKGGLLTQAFVAVMTDAKAAGKMRFTAQSLTQALRDKTAENLKAQADADGNSVLKDIPTPWVQVVDPAQNFEIFTGSGPSPVHRAVFVPPVDSENHKFRTR